jgi:hypothetical protein
MANVDGVARPRPTMLVRGRITDRPWGATLAAIGQSGRSGQLTLHTADHKVFRIAFAHGVVVGATSPQSVDSVPRIALAARLIAAEQARLWRKTDDVDRLAAHTNLSARQVQELKRRVIIQRVARTFSVDAGDYVVEDRITIPVMFGIEVDIRAAIYFGMRMNLSEQRLTWTRLKVGSRFVLRPQAVEDLPRYGFGEDEQPVLDALRGGTCVPELEVAHRDLDPRMIEAVICTLAVCDSVISTEVIAPQEMSLSRSPTPREPTMTRVPTPRKPTTTGSEDCVPLLVHDNPSITRSREISRPPTFPRTSTRALTQQRWPTDPFLDGQRTTRRATALSYDEVEQLIAVGIELLDRGVDHFTFLGLPYGASIADVREAYLEFARYLRPEKLAEIGIDDDDYDARSVFARVVIAFTVLTDPGRRAEYLRDMDRDPV